MGSLSSPTAVKEAYKRICHYDSTTGQVALDPGQGSDDTPLFRPSVDISKYGITGDLAATDQANFEAALTASAGETLVIDRPVSITSDTTIGATNTLHFTRGGYLSVSGDAKLVFTEGCAFNDTTHGIFLFSTAIRVEGVINHPFWRVEWFGSMPNDTDADCGAVVNAMFDHWESSGTGFYPRRFEFRAQFGQGSPYWFTDPLEIKLRTGSIMNDLVLSSSLGSRWGGACLRSTNGSNVISGGTGSLVTRVAFRNLQFSGTGTSGADQTSYVVDASIIDLCEFDNCGFFYCNRGLYMRDGGAGAAIFTNCYFVNLLATSTMLVNAAVNARFVACIFENGPMTMNGNSTEPLTLNSCHVERCSITVPEKTFAMTGPMGSTSSVTITLGPDTCNCYVSYRGSGTFVYDHGHYNQIDGSHRFVETKGIPSSIKPMAFPSTRDCGKWVLQKSVPWLLSIGVSKDGRTAVSPNTDYNFLLYDMAPTTVAGDTADADTFKDYGTITVMDNYTGFIPIWYGQIWDCVTPTTNAFIEPSHDCDFRATRPKNANPNPVWADVTVNDIDGWYTFAAPDSIVDDGSGNIRIDSSGTDSFSYGQYLDLEAGKTYVIVMKVTNNGGTDLPKLYCNASASSAGTESYGLELVNTTGSEYQAVLMFRPKNANPTLVSFGRDASSHDCDFIINFIAVAELGEGFDFISDGPPACGVFYRGAKIRDDNPLTNGATGYSVVCEAAGNYGAISTGAAMNLGPWVSEGSYTKGDCYSYNSRVYIARTTHDTVATVPSLDTTNWKPMETIDADGVYTPDGRELLQYDGGLRSVSKTAAYTASNLDDVIYGDAAGGGFTVTLMALADRTGGRPLAVKNVGASNNVTIDGAGAEEIDGSTTLVLTPGDVAVLHPGSSEWKDLS